MRNFWSSFAKASEDKIKLKKPLRPGSGQAILVLAPMAGYTDSAFRQMCKSFGADVVYSEMASATALAYNPVKTLEMLKFSEIERPYVVQLFGANPEHFAIAVKVVSGSLPLLVSPSGRGRKSGPDGIDINFGCPVKKVAKQGAGAVLMDNPKLAREIIKAVTGNTDLPVSIKIRTKVGTTDALKFLDSLNDLDIKTVMIHGRTLKQGFSGPVDASMMKKARNHFGGVILANGGVVGHETAVKLLAGSEADGLGIARGALGRPWIFEEVRSLPAGQAGRKYEACLPDRQVRSREEIFQICIKHAELVFALKGQPGIIEMRKHLCAYVQGLTGAKELRRELINAETLGDIRKILG